MITKFLNGNYKLILDAIEDGQNVSVFGLNMGEKLALLEDCAFLFFVVENEDNLLDVVDKLNLCGRKCEYISNVYGVNTSEFQNSDRDMSVIQKILTNECDSLVITSDVLLSLFPNPKNMKCLSLQVHKDINISNIVSTLTNMNYKRVELVSEANEFSVRGDILDIFPAGGNPTRISVDYDQIESIKIFNPVTMLTTSEIDKLEIFDNSFVSCNKTHIDNFFAKHKLNYDSTYEYLCMCKNNDYRLIGINPENYSTIFDYVPNGIIAFDGTKSIYDKIDSRLSEYKNLIKDSTGSLKALLENAKLDINDILNFKNHTLVAFQYITQANKLFSPQKVFSIRTLPPMNYLNFKEGLINDLNNFSKQNYTVILCVGSLENSIKYKGILEKANLSFQIEKSMSLCQKNCINILCKNYPLDVILPEEKLAIISTTSLLGKKKKVDNVKVDFFDGELPQKDDYVVHSIHGVGRCLGVQTLQISNSLRDYVIIEYKNNDKLYLPVENLDQISKYLGSDKAPTLNKIGGVEFAKTKAKVKSAIKKIAFDLVALYKERMNLKGYEYPKDDELQLSFENSFPFTETADQLKAITDCKNDMESGKIMDRLVCGDVGFGKTEVALRIAFKTITSGKQVAFLCPTTILSEQHFATAKSRMAEFGVKIEVLNRLKNATEVTKIKKDLADGKIDLIIGTHKLLASDIEYKNLGLLILDEEQKFGVADKDKIKNLKKSINVLTLSATPIPRTLNMSLIGVRDISVIETPPMQRIDSDVQVVEYSSELIKKAIDNELSRKGQVLIIYNRVEGIYNFANFIKSLCPNANVSVAHGQMTDIELEQEIYKLYSNVTQVLVATTLIENGVDLPNANTLIVINSDMLGLSQLYQLKGRIGRSDKNSFAYFTFDSKKLLTENAYKRLQAIKEFSGMGSGFKIAMRDLEIRGAGNLLGLEQSGHIEKIGYNMYVQMLNDSIKEINNENTVQLNDVRVETNISAYLSHDYISSSNLRMKAYRDISNLDSMEKYLEFINSCNNIYGDIPEEFVNLCKIGLIKNACAKMGATKVIIKEKSSIILKDKDKLTKNLVDSTLDEYANNVKLSFSGLPTIDFVGIDKDKMLDFIISYLQFVECL